MNKREIARQFSIDTVIYDPDLSSKAAKALSADMIEVSPEQCFDMDVVFDRHVYQNVDFYSFPLTKESPQPKGHSPKMCLSIRNCIKRAPKSTVPGQHRFGFEKPYFCSL